VEDAAASRPRSERPALRCASAINSSRADRASLWRHQIRALSAAGYRAIAPDQRGYGQTESPDGVDAYDITHTVGGVVGLINALGEKSAVVVGQDWG